ncbi:MAG: hypothetical protein ACPG6V_13070, partial [Flavobacteriales bacterium]
MTTKLISIYIHDSNIINLQNRTEKNEFRTIITSENLHDYPRNEVTQILFCFQYMYQKDQFSLLLM